VEARNRATKKHQAADQPTNQPTNHTGGIWVAEHRQPTNHMEWDWPSLRKEADSKRGPKQANAMIHSDSALRQHCQLGPQPLGVVSALSA
jgi:hypothetical protein